MSIKTSQVLILRDFTKNDHLEICVYHSITTNTIDFSQRVSTALVDKSYFWRNLKILNGVLPLPYFISFFKN